METATGRIAISLAGFLLLCGSNASRAKGAVWPAAVIIVVISQTLSRRSADALPQTTAQSPNVSACNPGAVSGTASGTVPASAKTSWVLSAQISAALIIDLSR